jgi:hypothetical protein
MIIFDYIGIESIPTETIPATPKCTDIGMGLLDRPHIPLKEDKDCDCVAGLLTNPHFVRVSSYGNGNDNVKGEDVLEASA